LYRYTLENPPPGILRVLAAVFVLLDESKVTDHLPPLAMLAAGTTNKPGSKQPVQAQPAVSLGVFFRQVDTDGSGALDAKELKRALRAIGLGAEEVEASMGELDADGDGKVTLFEFEAGLKRDVVARIVAQLNSAGTLDSFRPLVDVARLFGQFDADADGTLSPAELGSLLASLGLEGVDLDEAMAGFDTDGDGEISLEEWKASLSDRTKALMAKKLDERGLVAGYVPPVESVPAPAEPEPAAEEVAADPAAAEEEAPAAEPAPEEPAAENPAPEDPAAAAEPAAEEEAAAAPAEEPAPEEPAAASEEEPGPGPVVESVGGAGAVAAGGGDGPEPLGPIACLSAGERGALWDAIRLAINMDNTSGADFFPAMLARVASGPALATARCAAAQALVAGRVVCSFERRPLVSPVCVNQ
jgi:Ca2+-binding EF-hand superfamily protein